MSLSAQTRMWTAIIDAIAREVLGGARGSISEVERRFRQLLPDERAIVWESDADSFQLTYVSPAAVEILGYPIERWIEDQTFWADQVVAREDRDQALAHCAMEPVKDRDRVFEYRARRADGATLVMRDIIRVVRDADGVARQLRGITVDVTALRARARDTVTIAEQEHPRLAAAGQRHIVHL